MPVVLEDRSRASAVLQGRLGTAVDEIGVSVALDRMIVLGESFERVPFSPANADEVVAFSIANGSPHDWR